MRKWFQIFSWQTPESKVPPAPPKAFWDVARDIMRTDGRSEGEIEAMVDIYAHGHFGNMLNRAVEQYANQFKS